MPFFILQEGWLSAEPIGVFSYGRKNGHLPNEDTRSNPAGLQGSMNVS